jgi:hypothetical protein
LEEVINAVCPSVIVSIDSESKNFRGIRFMRGHHSMRGVGSTAAIATFHPTLSDVADIFRHMIAMIERADDARNLKFE